LCSDPAKPLQQEKKRLFRWRRDGAPARALHAQAFCCARKPSIFSVALLIACSWAVADAQAQPHKSPVTLPVVDRTDLRFVHIPFGEGLSHSRFAHIVQDNQGFLWFGTQDGLKRYDGYHFRD
jgi:hypothetical protein